MEDVLVVKDDSVSESGASEPLQLYQTIPFYLDNIYPYNPAQIQPHVLPNPLSHANAGSAGATQKLEALSYADRMALHLAPAAQTGLHTMSTRPDTFISWRILSDRKTLELRPLRWVASTESPPAPISTSTSTEGGSAQRRSLLPKVATGIQQEFDASQVGVYVFPAPLLPDLAVVDEGRLGGGVAVIACTETGVVYRLAFTSPWAVGGEGNCGWSPMLGASFYVIERYKSRVGAVVSGKNPVAMCMGDPNIVCVACADGSLTTLVGFVVPGGQCGDLKGFIEESTQSPVSILSSVRRYIPRMWSRSLSSSFEDGSSGSGGGGGEGQAGSGGSPLPIALAPLTLYGSQVKMVVTMDSGRRLRLWSLTGQVGCIYTKQFPLFNEQHATADAERQHHSTLAVRPRIRCLWLGDSADESGIFALMVHIPDPEMPYFALVEGQISPNHKISYVSTVMKHSCQPVLGIPQSAAVAAAANNELLDFQVVHRDLFDPCSGDEGEPSECGGNSSRQDAWVLWALWERDQESLITYTYFTLATKWDGATPAIDNKQQQQQQSTIRYKCDPNFGERWYTVIRDMAVVRPSATGGDIGCLDFIQRSEEVDNDDDNEDEEEAGLELLANTAATTEGGKSNPSASSSRLAREISDAFMGHLYDPLRFDRGVLAHSLALYEQSVKDRGFSLPSSAQSLASAPPVASSPRLYERAVATVGSFLRVEVSREDGSLLVSDYRRALHTEWMRYATLCSRLQRAANSPRCLVFCPATQMLTVIRGNSLAPLKVADEVEWMRAVVDGDAAAQVVLAAPPSLLADSYPELKSRNARIEVVRLLSAASYVSKSLGSDYVSYFTREARGLPSAPIHISLDLALIELFEKALDIASSVGGGSTAGWGPACVHRTMKLLRACRAPSQTIAHILRALMLSILPKGDTPADSIPAGSSGPDVEGGAFKTSMTMDGLVSAAFNLSIQARFSLVRDLLLLLTVVTYYEREAHSVVKDIPALLASAASTFSLFSLMQWVVSQPMTLKDTDSEASRAHRTSEESFLHRFSGLNVSQRQGGDGSMRGGDSSFVQALKKSASISSSSPEAATGANRLGPTTVITAATATSSPPAPALTYSLMHSYINRFIPLTFGGDTGIFADMISESVRNLYVSLKFIVSIAVNDSLDRPIEPMDYARKDLVEFSANVSKIASPGLTLLLLAYMPTSAATTYLWGRMYIDLGEYDLAANYFGRAAAAFYQTDPVMMAAQADLQYVLPPSVLEKGTAATYYLHIAELFGQVRRFDAVNRHCHLALIAATHEERAYGEHDSDLPKDLVEFKQTTWFKIFHSALDSRVYEEAYMAMMANPDERMRRDCLRHLVGVLCEEQGGKVTLLCRLGFPGLQDEVESNLLFKARNSDLFAHPNYYKILNSFHIFRGDYRAAASAMYQYAKRLGAALPYMQGDILEVTSKQAQAYLSCINSLQLVDGSSAWIVVSRQGPAVDGSGGKKRKKRRVEIERFNPKFGPALSGDRMQEQDLDIIELVDIRREYALALARLQLANKYPEFRTQNIQLDAEDAVILFVKAGMYDQAMSVSKTFGLDLDVVFQNLTRKCLSLAAQASEGRGELGLSGEEDDDAFWENEDVLEATGSPSEKAWCLLHSYLKRAEDPQAGGQLRYHYLVAETILKSETDFPLPPWLSAVLLKDRPQDLVRVCLRYGAITDATQFLIQHINSQVSQLSSPGYLAKTTCEFWLPYSLIDHTIRVLDSVIENVNAPEKGSPREFSERDDGPAGWRTLSVLREQLQSSLDTYMLYAKRESKDINHEINSSVPAAISAAMAMGV